MLSEQAQAKGNDQSELAWGIGTALDYLGAAIGPGAPMSFVEGLFLNIMRSGCVRWRSCKGLLRSDGDESFWRRARLENNQVVHWNPQKTRLLGTAVSADDLMFYCRYQLNLLGVVAPTVRSNMGGASSGLSTLPVVAAMSSNECSESESLLQPSIAGQHEIDDLERIAGRKVPDNDDDRRAIAMANILVASVSGGRVEKGLGKDGVIKRALDLDVAGELGGQIAFRSTYDRYWGVPAKGKPTRQAEVERLQTARAIKARFAA
ncbi:hypothetical protein QA645_19445 [Bradyrhizobium sp. CIAT3101]|uniref:hypothetical protein n=1 Tax=Bradyrhizobium sp. CIAT3101 TaxID=439387 RepID=UPI0024B13F21|nr:hypothetical protein [Bradyrhizobium sp. CIAT3101]WFU84831.1 hypothetical protein QA645_19445 [Bradyrhizobium sp. CIAT3101]